MKDEDLLNFYYYGWELCSDSAPFPNWFEFGYEKIACLIGYNDFTMDVVKEKEEILEEIKKRIK